MKLSTLALAIVAATATVSVQADVSLGGMARATYNGGGNDRIETKVELNLDASAESNGITYFGHAQLEGNGKAAYTAAAKAADPTLVDTGKDVTTDDIYVGMKGGFGEVRFGDTDGGCDATEVGGYPDYISDINLSKCNTGDQNNITYIGTAGAATYAISYSPENNMDYMSVGAKAKLGNATVSLGHSAGDGVSDTTALGLAGSFGPVGLGLLVSDVDGAADTEWTAHASYASGANSFAIGTNEPGDVSAYWKRDLGASTTFGIDVNAPDVGDTEVALRLQKGF